MKYAIESQTAIKGTGGIIVAKGTTVINVIDDQNAGGHYTVKTGVTLKLGGGNDAEYGSFQANLTGMLTYTVESGATLKFTSTNITGWGKYDQTAFTGTIAGTLRVSGLETSRVSGRYVIKNGAVFDNQVDDPSLNDRGLCFSGSTYEIEPDATATFEGKKFVCSPSNNGGNPIFILGNGATMDVTALGNNTDTMTVRGAGRLNMTSLTDGTLILEDSPTLTATGTMSTVTLDIRQNATIALNGRAEPLVVNGLATPLEGEHTLILDMTGWRGKSTLGVAVPLLTWMGAKPTNLIITFRGHTGLTIIEEPNQITAQPHQYVIPIIGEPSTVSNEILNYLHRVATQDMSISAVDATTAYAFTLIPSVENGVAVLDYRFKIGTFAYRASSGKADIEIDVIRTNAPLGAVMPQLAKGYKIGLYASESSLNATDYQSIGTLVDTLSPREGDLIRGSVMMMDVPVEGKAFFKARLILPL